MRELLVPILLAISLRAQVAPERAAVFLDFKTGTGPLELRDGAVWRTNEAPPHLAFDNVLARAELPLEGRFHHAREMTVGGWFWLQRSGEQALFSRGLPKTAPGGERTFPRERTWVNFVIGTDQRGFLLGAINGNGSMPFPRVTVQELEIGHWHQIALSKDARGVQRFFHNGRLVHSNERSVNGPQPDPFVDQSPGEPLRLMAPLGGRVGEAWVFTNALSPGEIERDYLAKRAFFHPTVPAAPVSLREMNAHFVQGLWPGRIDPAHWPELRRSIETRARWVLGDAPTNRASLEAKTISEEKLDGYLRRKVSIQVQPGDRMPFWVLIPEDLRAPEKRAAVICFYGTSGGTGKDSVVGLTGREPGSPPHPNLSFALDLVRAGFVAVAADYLRDGERIAPGRRPYDTTDFYRQFPEWSIHGKDLWDTQRLIDWLEAQEFVDARRIGMTGHSYGGHSTIFAAALEPRIKAAVANGPVSDFLHHGMHWGVPAGAVASQSMPRLRPFLLDRREPLPAAFYEFTALMAPRPLLVGQAVGERRPMEEENHAAVRQVYEALGAPEAVRCHWYAGDHDFPPEARAAMVEWFKRWL